MVVTHINIGFQDPQLYCHVIYKIIDLTLWHAVINLTSHIFAFPYMRFDALALNGSLFIVEVQIRIGKVRTVKIILVLVRAPTIKQFFRYLIVSKIFLLAPLDRVVRIAYNLLIFFVPILLMLVEGNVNITIHVPSLFLANQIRFTEHVKEPEVCIIYWQLWNFFQIKCKGTLPNLLTLRILYLKGPANHELYANGDQN